MAPATTIVLLKGFGNHSNRLLQAVSLEAFALEHGLGFANPGFYDMAPLYRCPVGRFDRLFRAFARGVELMKKAIPFNDRIIIHFDEEEKNDEYHRLLLDLAARNVRYIPVDGWHFHNRPLILKHRDFLIDKYTVRDDLLPDNDIFAGFDAERKHVALHIRRGDYRDFCGGKYYYEWDVYRRVVETMRKNIREQFGCGVRFLVFSDEDATCMADDGVVISRHPWYVDHVLMSRCDYIIGPPSTFSIWAAYIGRTRYHHLHNAAEAEFGLDCFNEG